MHHLSSSTFHIIALEHKKSIKEEKIAIASRLNGSVKSGDEKSLGEERKKLNSAISAENIRHAAWNTPQSDS